MCGILGLICDNTIWRSKHSDAFSNALKLMSHRGPDGAGLKTSVDNHYNNVVTFGHQRLAIFDLTDDGHQPMTDVRGRTITFNGEIFNWRELRNELEQLGYNFRSQTDTEVILAAYDAWGAESVKKFNGFWAFAIYDCKKSVVFMSRDRFGIKPLYYTKTKNLFAFSSEIRPLLEATHQNAVINSHILSEMLIFDNITNTNDTLYTNIKELPPATNVFIQLTDLSFSSSIYWCPDQIGIINRTDEEALEEFSYLIEDSTKLRLRSDIEVALTLSGGIDSSAIAAAISSVSDAPVQAFTSTFDDDAALDETEYAQQVAMVTKLPHTLVHTNLANIDAEESLLSKHLEIPYSSFSQLVNWMVMKSVSSKGIRVFLNGQGGDELFLGYERYYAPYLLNNEMGLVGKLKEYFSAVKNSRLTHAELLGFMVYFTGTPIRKFLYNVSARKYLNDALIRKSKQGRPYTLSRDMKQLAVDETCGAQLRRLLRFDDRISGAFGMEGRPVFLDHRLVEFAMSLQTKHKIRGGWTKYIIRKYLEKKGLPDIAWRTHKLGFPAPNREWTKLLQQVRNIRLTKSAFLTSILTEQMVDIEKLDPNIILKIISLESAAKQINWCPVED